MKYPFPGLIIKSLAASCFLVSSLALAADKNLPWGSASDVDQAYNKQKVVYDTTTSSVAGLLSVLDRAGFISKLNGADPFETKIVIMVHGGAIPFFASKNFQKNKELMERAHSLTLGEIVEFRMCKASARLQGFAPEDIQGFVKMVPMADAEIVRLQQEEGFAYMR